MEVHLLQKKLRNVKAFYGILEVLFSLGPTFFLYIASDPALQWYVEHTYYIQQHYINSSYSDFKPYNIEMSILL